MQKRGRRPCGFRPFFQRHEKRIFSISDRDLRCVPRASAVCHEAETEGRFVCDHEQNRILENPRHSKSTKTAKKSTKTTAKTAAAWHPHQMTPTPERYKEIQQALVDKGYLKSEPNGVWDAQSIDALRQFQTDQKLSVTGRISSASLIGLGLGPNSTPTPETPSAPAAPPTVPTVPAPPLRTKRSPTADRRGRTDDHGCCRGHRTRWENPDLPPAGGSAASRSNGNSPEARSKRESRPNPRWCGSCARNWALKRRSGWK